MYKKTPFQNTGRVTHDRKLAGLPSPAAAVMRLYADLIMHNPMQQTTELATDNRAPTSHGVYLVV
jgi:hypothetical protein